MILDILTYENDVLNDYVKDIEEMTDSRAI